MKIGIISLGCDKNRVDSEKMLYSLKSTGYEITDDAELADVIIINTCAFIEEAKKETVQTILETASLKQKNLKKLIVTGCFAQRYGSIADLPEVDCFLNIEEQKNIVSHIASLTETKISSFSAIDGRILTTPHYYAYLKIADGCNNHCSYCAIPSIRGSYKSMPIETIVKEAEELVKGGVKELILVAQDTTRYGSDLYGKSKLIELLSELIKLNLWKIRLLYAYPELISDELIEFIKNQNKMAKYLDLPLQHVNKDILKKMNRRGGDVKNLIERIREKCPEIALRSSFIIGFHGEGRKEYLELKDFIINQGVDYGGFFLYSREEGTPAYAFSGAVRKNTACIRKRRLEKKQCEKTVSRQSIYLGKTLEVIYEGIDYDKQLFYGRTEYQAPEVDTKVLFNSDFSLEVGNIYKVLITCCGLDLYGNTVK